MIKIEKIDGNISTIGKKISMYIIDQIDDCSEFTEWLYKLEDKEMTLMMPGNVYHFYTQEERIQFVFGFLKAFDMIDDEYIKKYHKDADLVG